MKWLATSPSSVTEDPRPTEVSTKEPPPVDLPHLTAFELGTLDVNRDTLLAVVRRLAPKLTHLSLWRMSIEAGPHGPYNPKPNIWSQFFECLASDPELGLTYLKVGSLTQDRFKVKFSAQVDDKGDDLREYSGKSMKSFIKRLAEDVFVDWPPEITLSDNSNSDEDEDMYDSEADSAELEEEEEEEEGEGEDGSDD